MAPEDEDTERIELLQSPSTSGSRYPSRRRSGRINVVESSPPVESDGDSESSQMSNEASQKRRKRVKLSGAVSGSEKATKKRPRRGEDSNDTESPMKKKRTTLEQNDGSSDIEVVEEDGTSEGNKDEPSPSNVTQKKISRRNKPSTSSAAPSQSQSTRRKAASRSQRISSQGSQSLFSQAQLKSHPGVIKSLHLTNFMCHSNFTHEFHHNLNFITGQNGSGKSALLSGILIALGGKATVTSRTTSLKALVQKGRNTGRVAVTLINENGLRRYGNEITIERWVNVNGSGGYRIKSSGGEDSETTFNWRPLKKPELDRILLGLNIQIDNPVAVLNQEVARSFLRSKDPKVKFNLFYDGTLLSKLETVIKETKVDLDETKTILAHQKQVIDAVKDEIIAKKQKCEKIAELEQIKEKLSEVHVEYLWSVVIEQEKAVEAANKAIEKVTKETELLNQKVDELKEQIANANEDSILQDQMKVRNEKSQKEKEVDRNRDQLNEVRKRYMNLKTKLRTIGSTIHAKETQISKLSASIEKVKADQDVKAKEETNQDSEILKKMQERKRNLESSCVQLKADADNFQQAGEQEREQLQQIESNVRILRTQIDAKRRQVSTMANKGVNKYTGFGPKMEQLMTKLQANLHRFKKPPRGPLGTCFRVKNQKYAPILEMVLFNHLHSFIVSDTRDLQLLRELIDSVYDDRGASQRQRSSLAVGRGKTPGIHCMRFADRMYDISRHHASHPDAPSILDLIEVENNDHIVMNALIDIAEIERQIVFENNTSAAQVLKHESTTPKTLKVAYTLQWYKFTPAPHYAARVMKVKERVEILKSGRSMDAEIDAVKSEMRALEQEIKSFEPRKAALRSKEQSLRAQYDAKTNEITDSKRKLGELVNEIKRHLSKVKEKERRCDLTSYYEELQELKDDLEKQVQERDVATKELEPLKPKVTEFENRKKTLDQEIQDLTAKINEFAETREEMNSKRMKIQAIMEKVKSRLASLEGSKSKLNKDLETEESELQDKLSTATEKCSQRINTKRLPADVKREFEGIQVRIDETESRLGNVNELKASLVESQRKFRRLKEEFSPLYKMHKVVEQTNVDQFKSFEKMKAHMGRTLTYFFSSMAKQRGYEGRLLADFETKELYYFVCPDGDSASKTIRAIDAQEKQIQTGPRTVDQMKQSKKLKKALIEYSLGLSGGERSFATICFIMALWQVMECPFYMLDEFDVFMDAFNRKTSQLALMAHAKRFAQNQFVLFTPLDIGEVPSKEDATVLRLYPPVRTGGGAAGNDGANQSGNAEASPQQGNSSANQGTSSTGGRRQNGRSPSDSPRENMDPSVTVSQGKGSTKTRGKQRRPAQATVMGLIQSEQ